MSQYLNLSAVEPTADPIATSQEPEVQPAQAASSEVDATSPATSYEGGANAHPLVWQPAEPQYTKAIAQYYGVSRKSVQEWFQKVKEACPWFTEADLKLPDERYTPLAIELMGDYRTSPLSFKAWKAHIWEQNPELVAAFQSSQQPSHPDNAAQNLSCGSDAEPTGELRLHIGSALNLPAIPTIVPLGDDTAYLEGAKQRLQQFEELQQQVIAQIQQQHEQAQALNAQYQEAVSLSDQLLLQEFQLKGVQLGYTALQLKQQAFKATVQAAEAGTLPVPGKPQPESAQASSD